MYMHGQQAFDGSMMTPYSHDQMSQMIYAAPVGCEGPCQVDASAQHQDYTGSAAFFDMQYASTAASSYGSQHSMVSPAHSSPLGTPPQICGSGSITPVRDGQPDFGLPCPPAASLMATLMPEVHGMDKEELAAQLRAAADAQGCYDD